MNRLLAILGVCAAMIATGCAGSIKSLPQSVDDVVFDANAYAQDDRFDFEETLYFRGVEVTDAYSSIIATFAELEDAFTISVRRANYPSVILVEDLHDTIGSGPGYAPPLEPPLYIFQKWRGYGIYLKPVPGGVQTKVLIQGKRGLLYFDEKRILDQLANDVENRKKPSRLIQPWSRDLSKTHKDDSLPDSFPISMRNVSFDTVYHGKKSLFGMLQTYEEVADFASYDVRSVFLAAIHSIELHRFIVQQCSYPSVLIAREPSPPLTIYSSGYNAFGIYLRTTSEGVQAKIIYNRSSTKDQRRAREIISGMREYLSSDAQATDPRRRYFPD